MALDTDACVVWPFARANGKYGHFNANKVYHLAHRYVCEMVHGPAPDDKPYALHSCHNGQGGCVNPRHLRWGSAKENTADILMAKRFAVGAAARKSELTEEDVRAIRRVRENGAKLHEIARVFGVSESAIHNIVKRKTWAHVA